MGCTQDDIDAEDRLQGLDVAVWELACETPLDDVTRGRANNSDHGSSGLAPSDAHSFNQYPPSMGLVVRSLAAATTGFHSIWAEPRRT
jgi:hypothetical protein